MVDRAAGRVLGRGVGLVRHRGPQGRPRLRARRPHGRGALLPGRAAQLCREPLAPPHRRAGDRGGDRGRPPPGGELAGAARPDLAPRPGHARGGRRARRPGRAAAPERARGGCRDARRGVDRRRGCHRVARLRRARRHRPLRPGEPAPALRDGRLPVPGPPVRNALARAGHSRRAAHGGAHGGGAEPGRSGQRSRGGRRLAARPGAEDAPRGPTRPFHRGLRGPRHRLCEASVRSPHLHPLLLGNHGRAQVHRASRGRRAVATRQGTSAALRRRGRRPRVLLHDAGLDDVELAGLGRWPPKRRFCCGTDRPCTPTARRSSISPRTSACR